MIRSHGVMKTKLINAMGGEAQAQESRETFDKLKDLAQKEFDSTVSQILDEPKTSITWEHQIAMLIGAARVHRQYRDMFTIKEK